MEKGRTFLVSGKFNDRFRDIYFVVRKCCIVWDFLGNFLRIQIFIHRILVITKQRKQQYLFLCFICSATHSMPCIPFKRAPPLHYLHLCLPLPSSWPAERRVRQLWSEMPFCASDFVALTKMERRPFSFWRFINSVHRWKDLRCRVTLRPRC